MNHGIGIATNATARMYVHSNGKVGIGTESPDQKLTVKGGGIGFDGNSGDKKLYSPTDGVLEWMTHDYAGGAFGRGFAVSHQGEKRVFLNTSGDSYINGGNVGIGTISPGAKLDVNGGANFNGNIGMGFGNISSVRSSINSYTNLFLGGGIKYNLNGEAV